MQGLDTASREAYGERQSQKQQNLELLMALENNDYAKYQQLLSQYNTDRSFNYGTVTISYNIYNAARNPKFTDYFSVGDRVDITGCTATTANNVKKARITAVADYELTFAGGAFTADTTETAAITVTRSMPHLDYICAANNRLWGVSNSESNDIYDSGSGGYKAVPSRVIYASALGLPERFWDYDGLSTDSYAVAVGTDGDFTGICFYSDNVLCWKERVLHKMLGSYPEDFYMATYSYDGLMAGCQKSIAIINEVLFYKGPNGVYAYSGSTPELVSGALGSGAYKYAVAGADGDTYYVSMQDASGAWGFWAYDTRHGTWLREDSARALDFAVGDDGIMFLCDDKQIYLETGGVSPVEWGAVFVPFYETYHSRKCYSRISLRVELDADAWCATSVSCDGGPWREAGRMSGRAGIFDVPVIPTSCDKFSVKISGSGGAVIRSMSREFRFGGK